MWPSTIKPQPELHEKPSTQANYCTISQSVQVALVGTGWVHNRSTRQSSHDKPQWLSCTPADKHFCDRRPTRPWIGRFWVHCTWQFLLWYRSPPSAQLAAASGIHHSGDSAGRDMVCSHRPLPMRWSWSWCWCSNKQHSHVAV